MESHEDIYEDGNQGEDNADDGTVCDILSYRRTNLCTADNRTAGAHVWVLECCYILLCHKVCLRHGLEQDILAFVVNSRVIRLNLVVGRYTDGLTVSSKGNSAHVGIAECSGKCSAHFLWLNSFLQFHNIVATTGEVDALAQSANTEADDEQYSCNAPNGECLLVGTHEVEVGILHEVL